MLKGRSAASPPNPNLVPSGKVPPPVPPRGTGPSRTGRSSEEHRTAGATASTTSSVTSSRGDEAAIITRYRLHDSSCDLHRPLPPDLPSSATTAVTSTITAATSTKAIAISNALHARTSTLDTYRVTHHDSFDGETGSDDRPDWCVQDLNEEFVSVEKVEDAYFIRTSPYPFRPDRGIYRSDRWREFGGAGNEVSRRDQGRDSIEMDHLAKFTYFLNPSSRGDLMDYKMSRKDKKHSETYYERMKRKQKDLEASITTITMSYRRKSMGHAKATDASFYAKKKFVEESVRQKISRFAKKDGVLLQKIREKAKRKKRLAPKPKRQISATFNASLDEAEETKEKKEDKRFFSKIDFQAKKNDNYKIQEKNDTKNVKDERRQSTIRCDKSFEMKNSSTKNSNYFGDKNISKIINDQQENKRSGFKGIFPKGSRVEDKDEKKIVRERISNFDRQTNEKLRKYEDSSEFEFDIKKNNPKDMNRDKLLNITKSETLISSSLDIKNSNVLKSFVSEKVKSFEKIKARDETRNSEQEKLCLYNLNEGGVNIIKQKFTSSTNKTQLNQEEEKIGLTAEILNIKHERFKSLSGGNDLSFNSQEFGMIRPNVSFLHTYRKTRSFT